MIVDIRGANTHIKGAHLMLCAIVEALGDKFSLAASPNGNECNVRARLGPRQKMLVNRDPASSAALRNAPPTQMKSAFGLANGNMLGGVLDATGFACSDSFSAERSRREGWHAARWKKHGVPQVFLAQAFGPFQKEDQAKWMRDLLLRAGLVFGWDAVSFQHVRDLDARIRVEIAPVTALTEFPQFCSPKFPTPGLVKRNTSTPWRLADSRCERTAWSPSWWCMMSRTGIGPPYCRRNRSRGLH